MKGPRARYGSYVGHEIISVEVIAHEANYYFSTGRHGNDLVQRQWSWHNNVSRNQTVWVSVIPTRRAQRFKLLWGKRHGNSRAFLPSPGERCVHASCHVSMQNRNYTSCRSSWNFRAPTL